MIRATEADIAWVLRVHNVGEEAAQRGRKRYEERKKSTGWELTLAEARALSDRFCIFHRGETA